jgi:hypothetical protein
MDTMLNIVPQSIARLPAAQKGLSKGMMVRPTAPSSEPLHIAFPLSLACGWGKNEVEALFLFSLVGWAEHQLYDPYSELDRRRACGWTHGMGVFAPATGNKVRLQHLVLWYEHWRFPHRQLMRC